MAARTLFFLLFHRQVFQITGDRLAGTIKNKAIGLSYGLESRTVPAFHASPMPLKHVFPGRALTPHQKGLICPASFHGSPMQEFFSFSQSVFPRHQQIKMVSSTNRVAENDVPSPIPSMDLGGLRKETSRQVTNENIYSCCSVLY